jgi:hypothetical protein
MTAKKTNAKTNAKAKAKTKAQTRQDEVGLNAGKQLRARTLERMLLLFLLS